MTPATLETLPPWAEALLRDGRVGHLGLLDDEGRPRVLPVTFAVHGQAVWTAIDNKPKARGREPARVRWLRERPGAALTVDRYEDDWSQLCWVQLLGTVTLIDGPPEGPVLEALAGRYPQYRDEQPPGPLLRLAPARALWWRAAA